MKNNTNQKEKYMQQVSNYIKDSKNLKLKHNITERPVINFPNRHKVPILSKIALWVLRKQGGTLDMNYKILKTNNK